MSNVAKIKHKGFNITKLSNTNDTTADTSYTATVGQYHEKKEIIKDIYDSLLRKHVNLRSNDDPDFSIKTTISKNNIKIPDNKIISVMKPAITVQNKFHLQLPKNNVSISNQYSNLAFKCCLFTLIKSYYRFIHGLKYDPSCKRGPLACLRSPFRRGSYFHPLD